MQIKTLDETVKAILSMQDCHEKLLLNTDEMIRAANSVLLAADKIYLTYLNSFAKGKARLFMSGCHLARVGSTYVQGHEENKMSLKHFHLKLRRKVPAMDYVIQIEGFGVIPSSLVRLCFNGEFPPPRPPTPPIPPPLVSAPQPSVLSVEQFYKLKEENTNVTWHFGGIC